MYKNKPIKTQDCRITLKILNKNICQAVSKEVFSSLELNTYECWNS